MAHPDLDQLLNVLLPFAQKMLAEHGSFHPFGAAIANDGKPRMVGAQIKREDSPKAADLIQLLEKELRKSAEAGMIRASGICFDVRVIPPGRQEKTDAVQMNLEHANGQAMAVFLPYWKSMFKKISYGDMFSSHMQRKIFVNVGK